MHDVFRAVPENILKGGGGWRQFSWSTPLPPENPPAYFLQQPLANNKKILAGSEGNTQLYFPEGQNIARGR